MRRIGAWRIVVMALVGGLLATGCASTAGSSASGSGGVATFAEYPGTIPNYVFPMISGAYIDNANLYQFSNLLYPPLYWFGSGGQPVLNSSLSLAQPPVFSDNNSLVTITLKHWVWSNGKPITARDVVFWMNLLEAVTDPAIPSVGNSSRPGAGWGDYVPGAFPQNVISYSQTSTYSLQLRLNGSYNPTWFLFNELSQIVPIPQGSWDKVSLSGPVANYDSGAQRLIPAPASDGLPPGSYVPADPGTPTSGALGVAEFLNGQSEKLGAYSSNPLWKVVDGPFFMAQYNSNGFVKMVPNKQYSGTPKPSISAFELEPFTTDSSEFNALASGQVTIGYIPLTDLKDKTALERSKGYKLNPWYAFGFYYINFNFTNPAVGPVFDQLYIRQAMQSLINQPQYIKDFNAGFGTVENGPVPSYPPHNPYESRLTATGQVYPYDPAKAASLLREHGWTVVPGGTSYCSRAGTGIGECGRGIKTGQRAQFNLVFPSGITTTLDEMEAFQSALKKEAGIDITLSQSPGSTVIATILNGCTPSRPCSNWQIGEWGGDVTYGPDYFPTGGVLFSAGAGANGGDYSNLTNQRYIGATHTAATRAMELKALAEYQNFIARQLPVLFVPNLPEQFTMYKSSLKGLVPQGIYDQVTPQYYSFS